MNAMRSLSDFFDGPDVTLENCDTEAIHLSGQVQKGCALLAICKNTNKIVAASDNAAAFFFVDASALIGSRICDIDPELDRIVSSAANEPNMHEVLEYDFKIDGVDYDVVTYLHDRNRVIEFLPNHSASLQSIRANMRQCSNGCARIMNAKTLKEAYQIAADSTRNILGFSRVTIYQFLPDWSGEVLAESRDEADLATYLGLHFPAADIPAQAREMMKIVRHRAISDVTDENHTILCGQDAGEIDLTWSAARSISKMHTQYLRNMGVSASFSSSLLHQGKLWGVIAAHHSSPGMVPFDTWGLIQEIGTALMIKLEQIDRLESARKIRELRTIEKQFATALRAKGDLESVIATLVPNLRTFLKADGFAFQFGDKVHVCGTTPPEDLIRELSTWARSKHGSEDQFQTAALHRVWPKAMNHVETACGVLIQSIVAHRVCQLIWFRGPVTRKTKWAGRPNKSGTKGRLTPRGSFDLWVQEHRDEALPWQESDLDSAQEVFTEFLDILASQLLLKEENSYLRQFAASAVHDIKAPLRGISAALEIMREEDFDESIVKQTHSMAESSARRLMDLSSGLLDLAAIEECQVSFSPIELQTVVSDACNLLAHDIAQAEASVDFLVHKTVDVNGPLLLRLFLNLIQNALKYRAPNDTPKITISVLRDTPDFFEIGVTDNGIGIEPKFAKRIFKPLTRLHGQAEIEGAGLGLPICARIVEAHNGKIYVDETYVGGARLVIRLPNTT